MVDCGVTFNRQPGKNETEILMANPGFIEERKEDLVALVLTHAHEDHLGAVCYLWHRLQCPVYATPFAAYVLNRKLREAGIEDKVEVIEVSPGSTIEIDPFSVEWLDITHSIPEANSLIIRTEAGNILHTGDWKLDKTPVLGKPFQKEVFAKLNKETIKAMVCDSTNALEEGNSESEGNLYSDLLKAVKAGGKSKVVVTTFGSNLARLNTLARIAKKNRQGNVFAGKVIG